MTWIATCQPPPIRRLGPGIDPWLPDPAWPQSAGCQAPVHHRDAERCLQAKGAVELIVDRREFGLRLRRLPGLPMLRRYGADQDNPTPRGIA